MVPRPRGACYLGASSRQQMLVSSAFAAVQLPALEYVLALRMSDFEGIRGDHAGESKCSVEGPLWSILSQDVRVR